MNAPLNRTKYGKKFDDNYDRIFRGNDMSIDTPHLQFSKSWKSPKENQDIYIAKQDAYIVKLEKIVKAAREFERITSTSNRIALVNELKELDGEK